MLRTNCYFCGLDLSESKPLFSESNGFASYSCYHCPLCDVYQTLGDLDAISPDYVDLTDIDLTEDHLYLQKVHKYGAFLQLLERANTLKSPKTIDEASLIDIGCGVGGFLDYVAVHHPSIVRYGFDASRVQASHAQLSHLNVRYGLDIRCYMAEVQATGFDIVTMWDVFEHIRNPLEFLDAIKHALNDQGLLIISVPAGNINRIKVFVRKLQRRSPGLIPWEHVFYYTQRSLSSTLEKSGFKVLEIGPVHPYCRKPGISESVRVILHKLLGPTRFAFQIYAIGRKV